MLQKLQEMGYVSEDIPSPTIEITKENLMDIICLSNGSFFPLKEFVDKENFQSILDYMKLKTGEVWPLPIILNVSKIKADSLTIGEEISLVYNKEEIAKFFLKEKYPIDKEEYCLKIFGTNDKEHPGVKEIMNQGEIVLSGGIQLIKNPIQNKYSLSPNEIKKIINEKNLKTIAAFHTRNPIHRSHEFLQRAALEHVDGLLIQPVIGKKKSGDFEEEYIIRSYEIMMEKFYPKDKVIFCTIPTYSRYAGPREAVFTALLRKNFGATHFIVGRDHTGVGNFYSKYDSQKIFENLENLGIEIIKFHAPFYCNICKQYVTEHTCSHENRIDISGTAIRDMFNQGILPPEEVMRSEIAEIIIKDIKSGKEYLLNETNRLAYSYKCI